MEQNLYGEFQILPLTTRHKVNSFYSSNIDLNDFFKNDALKYQEEMAGRTFLCCWKKDIAGYVTLVTDTLDSKPESLGFYEKHNFKIVKKYMHSKYPKMYLDMYPIATLMRSKESLE